MAKTKKLEDVTSFAEDLKIQAAAILAMSQQVDTIVHATKRMMEHFEDAKDVSDVRAIMEGVRTGEIETFPAEVVTQLINGENPVRLFRKFRKMTGEQLAEKVGISRPYLTQIETGKRDATFGVMTKIARALDIDLDLLAPSPEELNSTERKEIAMSDDKTKTGKPDRDRIAMGEAYEVDYYVRMHPQFPRPQIIEIIEKFGPMRADVEAELKRAKPWNGLGSKL